MTLVREVEKVIVVKVVKVVMGCGKVRKIREEEKMVIVCGEPVTKSEGS